MSLPNPNSLDFAHYSTGAFCFLDAKSAVSSKSLDYADYSTGAFVGFEQASTVTLTPGAITITIVIGAPTLLAVATLTPSASVINVMVPGATYGRPRLRFDAPPAPTSSSFGPRSTESAFSARKAETTFATR